MRHRLVILALLAFVSLLAAAAAQAELKGDGDLRVRLNGGFAPTALPRSRPAPVTAEFSGEITTTDGTRPPALNRFELALNRNGRIDDRGLPTCTAARLQSVSSQSALARCQPALVGHGSFGADVESGTTAVPAHGQILVFNARRHGKPALLLHLYGTVPVRASFVLPLEIQHRGGELGTVLAADVPVLASGLGSITRLQLTIGREYRYRGQRHSYLSAACAAPAEFFRAPFTFARGTFVFADGRRVQMGLSRECRVREPAGRGV